MDFEIRAPAEIVEAFRDARRSAGWFLTYCPVCDPGQNKRGKRTLRAGIFRGRPWWGCMRCQCQKDYSKENTKALQLKFGSRGLDDEKSRRERAMQIWESTSDIQPGDPVDRYLREHRKLVPLGRAWPIDLRRALLKHPDKHQRYMAMVAAVRTLDGTLTAVHRTFVLDDGTRADGKMVPEHLRVENAKLSVGSLTGGTSVRVGIDENSDILGVAEGIESALAFQMRIRLPCWSAIASEGMKKLRVPKTIRRVIIGFDVDPKRVINGRDVGEAGLKAALALRERLLQEATDEGRQFVVELRPPPSACGDWADWAGQREAR